MIKIRKRTPLHFLSERRLRRMAYTQAGKARELDNLCDLGEPWGTTGQPWGARH
jgi:hypothetical protein